MQVRFLWKIPVRGPGHLLGVAALITSLGLVSGLALAQATAPSSEATQQVVEEGTAESEPAVTPQPAWACDEQTATAEPVWRGEKNLTFAFEIRNEGTADLKINARGG